MIHEIRYAFSMGLPKFRKEKDVIVIVLLFLFLIALSTTGFISLNKQKPTVRDSTTDPVATSPLYADSKQGLLKVTSVSPADDTLRAETVSTKSQGLKVTDGTVLPVAKQRKSAQTIKTIEASTAPVSSLVQQLGNTITPATKNGSELIDTATEQISL